MLHKWAAIKKSISNWWIGHLIFSISRWTQIENGAPDVKECIEAVLIDTMASKEVLETKDKAAVFGKLKRYDKLQSASWQGILNTVYDQLYDNSKAVYEIDLDFINNLGSNYLSLRTETMMKLVGGGADNDIIKKAMDILAGMRS